MPTLILNTLLTVQNVTMKSEPLSRWSAREWKRMLHMLRATSCKLFQKQGPIIMCSSLSMQAMESIPTSFFCVATRITILK